MINPNRCLSKYEGHVIIGLLLFAIMLLIFTLAFTAKKACAGALPFERDDWVWLKEAPVTQPLNCTWQGNLYR